MNNTAFKIFIQSIYQLAKTLVIKHGDIATTINHNLMANGYTVNWNQPNTWRYYMNLNGEYHEADMAEIAAINEDGTPYMKVKIASNAGPVDAIFNKALIDPVLGDVALANEYAYGGSFYNELVSKYPEQESLILGILNPVDKTTSINAKDGDLLYCGNYYKQTITDSLGTRTTYSKRNSPGLNDPKLIEDHEVDMLFDLEIWIKNYLGRWYIPDFAIIEDVYLHTILANLYSAVPSFIFNHRLGKCFTEQAHSFHIKSFLESHGKLAKYADALPLKQLLFLYRNLRWIERNAGKHETFQLMVDNLATPCSVPLTGYKLVHSLANQPEELKPDVILQREIINFVQTGSASTTVTVERMLQREREQAKRNAEDIEATAIDIEERVKVALDSEFPTKIIESDMVDNTSILPYKLGSVLFNHWIYTAVNNTYTANVFATNPKTADKILLTPLNALILAIYCLNKGYTGTAPVNVPVLVARNIPKQGPFNYPLLLKRVENSRVTAAKITDLIGSNPCPFNFSSSESFYSGCEAIHAEIIRRYNRIAKESYINAHAQMRRIMGKLYFLEINCSLVSGTVTYNDWLLTNGFVLDNFTRDDFISLGVSLVAQTTGNKLNSSKQLSSLQESVIEIMKQFSSYSVQYLYRINSADTVLLNIHSLRTDNIKRKMSAKLRLPLNLINVRDLSFTPKPTMVTIQTTPVIIQGA